jgi:hypothetical protein
MDDTFSATVSPAAAMAASAPAALMTPLAHGTRAILRFVDDCGLTHTYTHI